MYHKDSLARSPELYQAATLTRIRAGANVTLPRYIEPAATRPDSSLGVARVRHSRPSDHADCARSPIPDNRSHQRRYRSPARTSDAPKTPALRTGHGLAQTHPDDRLTHLTSAPPPTRSAGPCSSVARTRAAMNRRKPKRVAVVLVRPDDVRAIAEAKRAGVFISGYDGANLPLPSNEELRRRGLDVLPQTDSNDDEQAAPSQSSEQPGTRRPHPFPTQWSSAAPVRDSRC